MPDLISAGAVFSFIGSLVPNVIVALVDLVPIPKRPKLSGKPTTAATRHARNL